VVPHCKQQHKDTDNSDMMFVKTLYMKYAQSIVLVFCIFLLSSLQSSTIPQRVPNGVLNLGESASLSESSHVIDNYSPWPWNQLQQWFRFQLMNCCVYAQPPTCPPDAVAIASATHFVDGGTNVTWSSPIVFEDPEYGTINGNCTSDPPLLAPVGDSPIVCVFNTSVGLQNCSFNATVNDVTAPEIACPLSSTVVGKTAGSQMALTWTLPTPQDNVYDSGMLFLNVTHAPGSQFMGNTTTIVEYFVSDPSGNFNKCNFTATVEQIPVYPTTSPTNDSELQCTLTELSTSSVSPLLACQSAIHITDGSAPAAPYATSQCKSTTICSQSAWKKSASNCVVSLEFHRLDIEPCCGSSDALFVYDGDSTLAAPIVSYTSSDLFFNPSVESNAAQTLPTGVHSSGACVTLAFISDTNQTDATGFDVSYKETCGMLPNLNFGPVVTNITSPQPADGERFGGDIRSEGSLLIIPAATSTGGLVYAYTRNASTDTWILRQTIDRPSSGDIFFGSSISIWQGTLAIGLRQAVYIYEYSETLSNFTMTARLTVAGAHISFGLRASLSRDTIVVGASQSGISFTFGGAAYVFARVSPGTAGSDWQLTQTLTSPDAVAAGDLFGTAVAIHGNIMIISALKDADVRVNAGAAYVYERQSSSGVTAPFRLVQKLTGDNGGVYSMVSFGWRIELSDDTAVISCADSGTPGGVFVFDRNDTTGQWTQNAFLTSYKNINSAAFGSALSLQGHYLAVGSNDDSGAKGAVFIFHQNSTTRAWSFDKLLVAPVPQLGAKLGESVQIIGDEIVTGARFEDITFPATYTNAGVVYVYKFNQSFLHSTPGASIDSPIVTFDANITSAVPQQNGAFGARLAIDDSSTVALVLDASRSPSGANIFARTSISSSWQRGQMLNVSGLNVAATASSVDAAQHVAIVGLLGDSAVVFERNVGSVPLAANWRLSARFNASDHGFVFQDGFADQVAVCELNFTYTSKHAAAFIATPNQVVVYERGLSTWTHVQTIAASAIPGTPFNLTACVASRTFAALGFPSYQSVADSLARGAVQVYRRSNVTNLWQTHQLLTASSVQTGFGIHVSLVSPKTASDRGYILIGSPYANGYTGNAAVYELEPGNSDTWKHVATLSSTSISITPQSFGIRVSVATDGVAAIVGTGGNLYVFERSKLSETWFHTSTDIIESYRPLQVVVGLQTVLVGSPNATVAALSNAGTLYALKLATGKRFGPAILNCKSTSRTVYTNSSTLASTTVVTWPEPVIIDDQDPRSCIDVYQTHYSGDGFGVGNTNVLYTATDTEGFVGSCNFSVTVNLVDIVPPVVANCPANITVNSAPTHIQDGGTAVTWTAPVATDDTDGSMVTETSTYSSGDIFAAGTPTNVLYTFTDKSNNSASCSFFVEIVDVNPPLIPQFCVPGGFINASASATHRASAGTIVTWSDQIFNGTDITDGTIVGNCSEDSGSRFVLGTHTVVCVYVDSTSRTSNCTFNVLVQDLSPPQFSSCIDRNVTGTAGGTFFNASKFLLFSIDNVDVSSSLSLALVNGPPQLLFAVGNHNVTVSATDTANNVATCTFELVVLPIQNVSLLSTIPAPNAIVEASLYNASIQLQYVEDVELAHDARLELCDWSAIQCTTLTLPGDAALINVSGSRVSLTLPSDFIQPGSQYQLSYAAGTLLGLWTGKPAVAVNPSTPQSMWMFSTNGGLPPTVFFTSPVSGSSFVPLSSTNVTITFDESIRLNISTAVSNGLLLTDATRHQSFVMQQASLAPSSVIPSLSNVLVLSLPSNVELQASTLYRVTLPARAVMNRIGQVLSLQFEFEFSTSGQVTPNITRLSPYNGAFLVDPMQLFALTLEYDANVQFGNGAIRIWEECSHTFVFSANPKQLFDTNKFDVTVQPQIGMHGSAIVTVNISTVPLQSGCVYQVVVEPTFVQTPAGVNATAIQNGQWVWQTTQGDPPLVVSQYPSKPSAQTSIANVLANGVNVTFDEVIQLNAQGNITVSDAARSVIHTFSLGDSSHVRIGGAFGNNKTLVLLPAALATALDAQTPFQRYYSVAVSENAVINSIHQAYDSSKDIASFIVFGTAPSSNDNVLTLERNPTNGSLTVSQNLVVARIRFNQTVRAGVAGVVLLQDDTTGVAVELNPRDTAVVQYEWGGWVTIVLPFKLQAGHIYRIIIQQDAFNTYSGQAIVAQPPYSWLFAISNVVAAPRLSAAVLKPNVLVVEATFDATTDLAGKQIGESFVCTDLLDSATTSKLAPNAQCSWRSASELEISVAPEPSTGSSASISAPDLIGVKPGLLRSSTQLSAFTPASSVALRIDAPISVQDDTPFVVITGLMSIDSCTDVVIDATATRGNAGRPLTFTWSLREIYSFDLQRTLDPSSQLLTEINSAGSNTLRIPAQLLTNNVRYVFQVRAQNWIGKFSTVDIPVVREAFGTAAPNVGIRGSLVRELLPREDLVMNAESVCTSCASIDCSAVKTHYTWSIVQPQNSELAALLQSMLPPINGFPRYTVQQMPTSAVGINKKRLHVLSDDIPPLGIMCVQVRASYKYANGSGPVSAVYSSATSCVYRRQQQLVPIVGPEKGATVRLVWLNGIFNDDIALTLDASPSFDPEVYSDEIDTSTSRDAALNATFACSRFTIPLGLQVNASVAQLANLIANSVPDACDSELVAAPVAQLQAVEPVSAQVPTGANKIAYLRRSALAPNRMYRIVLTVNKGDRASLRTLYVVPTVDSARPHVQLSLKRTTSTATQDRFNPNDKILAEASISNGFTPSQVLFQWNVDGIDMTNFAQFTTADPSNAVYPLNQPLFGVKPRVLTQRSVYIVTVKASLRSDPSKFSVAEIEVPMNLVPRPGTCSASPSFGEPLVTSFTFTCSNWVDEDLPLAYRFELQSAPNGVPYMLRDFIVDASSATVSALPLTSTAGNGKHTVRAYVQDALGASAHFDFDVDMNLTSPTSDITISQQAVAFVTSNMPELYAAIEVSDFQQFDTEFSLSISALDVTQVVADSAVDETTVRDRATARQALLSALELFINSTSDEYVASTATVSEVIQTIVQISSVVSVSSDIGLAELSPDIRQQAATMILNRFNVLLALLAQNRKVNALERSTSRTGADPGVALGAHELGNCPEAMASTALSATDTLIASATLTNRNDTSDRLLLANKAREIVELCSLLIGCNAVVGEIPVESIGGRLSVRALHSTAGRLRQDTLQSSSALGFSNRFNSSATQLTGQVQFPSALLTQYGQHLNTDQDIFFSFSVFTGDMFSFNDTYVEGVTQDGTVNLDGTESFPATITSATARNYTREITSRTEATESKLHISDLPEPVRIGIGHKPLVYFRDDSVLCRFWNISISAWDSRGCTFNGTVADPSQPGAVISSCLCTHFTEFSAATFTPSIRTISARDILALSWDNLMDHPSTLIAMGILLVLTLILLPIVRQIDVYNDSAKRQAIDGWGITVRRKQAVVELSESLTPSPDQSVYDGLDDDGMSQLEMVPMGEQPSEQGVGTTLPVSSSAVVFATIDESANKSSATASGSLPQSQPLSQVQSNLRVSDDELARRAGLLNTNSTKNRKVQLSSRVINEEVQGRRRRMQVEVETAEEVSWCQRVYWPEMATSHLWLAMCFRHPRDRVRSVEHLAIFVIGVLFTFVLAALFFGNQPGAGAEIVVAIFCAIGMTIGTVVIKAFFRGTSDNDASMGVPVDNVHPDGRPRYCMCFKNGKKVAWVAWTLLCCGSVFLTLVYGLQFDMQQYKADFNDDILGAPPLSGTRAITPEPFEEDTSVGALLLEIDIGTFSVIQSWIISVVSALLIDALIMRPFLTLFKLSTETLVASVDRTGIFGKCLACLLLPLELC
jgi:REJ domain/HYR domain/FG-GAP repeat